MMVRHQHGRPGRERGPGRHSRQPPHYLQPTSVLLTSGKTTSLSFRLEPCYVLFLPVSCLALPQLLMTATASGDKLLPPPLRIWPLPVSQTPLLIQIIPHCQTVFPPLPYYLFVIFLSEFGIMKNWQDSTYIQFSRFWYCCLCDCTIPKYIQSRILDVQSFCLVESAQIF